MIHLSTYSLYSYYSCYISYYVDSILITHAVLDLFATIVDLDLW